MARFFTLEKAKKKNVLKYHGGRYESDTPAAAAKKAFSQIYRHMRRSGSLSLYIHIRETTIGSDKKIYKYKVTKIPYKTVVERGGEIIVYKYKTQVEALH